VKLISWNIQWGKGCDGTVDLARVVRTAKAFADADVFCFQEVSENFAELDGGSEQSVQLAALLPEYRAVFGPAVETVDAAGMAHRFGNMTFSRLPVLQYTNHILPFPRFAPVRSMRRSALEVIVLTPWAPMRITNTHLEYHSAAQRAAQIERLLDLQQEASAFPVIADPDHRDPYTSQSVAASAILCGDFNFDVSDPQHAMIDAASRPGLNYRDAWTLARPGGTRDLTCGIHDRVQWQHGPDCRDFIFVTQDLEWRVSMMSVNTETDASDHQPLLIEVDEGIGPFR
jgi:endonuclease/exonuclease/phosphatase family metal-dependent hydrolase